MPDINLGTMVTKITGDTSGLIKARKDADKQINGLLGGMKKHSTAMLMAGGAIAGGLVLATKKAGDFQQGIINAVSVTGLMGDEAKTAEDSLVKLGKELGLKTKFSAKTAADAMYDLASSGWKVSDMAKGLPGIMDLAAATQADLTMTTETVTSTLKQFGLQSSESGRVADVFTKSISSSKATIDKLAASMSYAGPVAHSIGMPLEETTAILSKLYDAGMDGSKAGTILRGALTRLMDPTEKAQGALSGMGLSIDDVNPSMHEMTDILQTLRDHSMTTKDAIQIFGQRAGPGMITLIEPGTQGIRDLDEALQDAGGTAGDIADVQLNTLNGQMTIMKGSLEGLAISIGENLIPALTPMITNLTTIINKFSSLPKPVLATITKIAVFGGGALLAAGLVGKMSGVIGTTIKTLGAMGGVITKTVIPSVISFQAAIGPIGWAIEAVIAIVALLVIAWKNDWGGIQEKTRAVWEKLQPIFHKIGGALHWIIDVVKDVIGWFVNLFEKVGKAIEKVKNFLGLGTGEYATEYNKDVEGSGNALGIKPIGGYAEGGAVYGPTLAVLGEKATRTNPEYAIPNKILNKLIGQGNTPQQVTITYNIYGDAEQIKQQLRQHDRELLGILRGGKYAFI